jgi:hypothetical protein
MFALRGATYWDDPLFGREGRGARNPSQYGNLSILPGPVKNGLGVRRAWGVVALASDGGMREAVIRAGLEMGPRLWDLAFRGKLLV